MSDLLGRLLCALRLHKLSRSPVQPFSGEVMYGCDRGCRYHLHGGLVDGSPPAVNDPPEGDGPPFNLPPDPDTELARLRHIRDLAWDVVQQVRAELVDDPAPWFLDVLRKLNHALEHDERVSDV